MRIKKYISKTFQEGKLLILEELGEDAVILSSRTTPIDSNGESNIEIIAGINEESASKESIENISDNEIISPSSSEQDQINFKYTNPNNQTENKNTESNKERASTRPNNLNDILNSYRNSSKSNLETTENNINENKAKKTTNDLMSRLESLAKPISNIINKIEEKPNSNQNIEKNNNELNNGDYKYNDYSRDYLINNRIQESYSGKNISNIDLSFITTTNADLSEIKKILRNLETIERYKNSNLLSPTHQRLYKELIDAEINDIYALEILGVATQNLYKNIQSHLKNMIFESVSNFNNNAENSSNNSNNSNNNNQNSNQINSGFNGSNIFTTVNDYTLLKREINTILVDNLNFGSHLHPSKKQQRIIFVGPSGSGKTSALIKLAIITKLLHNSKILIVSADSYKVGGVEQLQTLSAIASINFKSAFTNQELQKVLLDASDYEFVFIDTSGKSPNDPNYMKEIRDFMNISQPTTSYLVQNATTNFKTFKKILENFSIFKISGLILSKIDETESIGNILYLLKESNLNLSYFTNGQQIPDDLEPASSSKLISFIFNN